jgi:hypothetical protein
VSPTAKGCWGNLAGFPPHPLDTRPPPAGAGCEEVVGAEQSRAWFLGLGGRAGRVLCAN